MFGKADSIGEAIAVPNISPSEMTFFMLACSMSIVLAEMLSMFILAKIERIWFMMGVSIKIFRRLGVWIYRGSPKT